MTAVGRLRSKKQSAGQQLDWRRIAYLVMASRLMDDIEETTNKNKTSVPKEHLILYQFSARGHDVGQVILGSLIDQRQDAAGAYYRSRPLLITLGLSLEDAMASPLGRSGGFSDGRDIGVVWHITKKKRPNVLPM
jgi:2-oxoisovalerate dehydrogenase E1 component